MCHHQSPCHHHHLPSKLSHLATQALFALASVALARPADEAAAVAPLVYGLPYGALAAPGYQQIQIPSSMFLSLKDCP